MSLATDILKRATIPTATKSEKRRRPPECGPRLPTGVYTGKDKRRSRPTVIYRAYSHKPVFTIIGEFRTAGRAWLAIRLYNLWLSRGFEDISSKPSIKTYRMGSDKS